MDKQMRSGIIMACSAMAFEDVHQSKSITIHDKPVCLFRRIGCNKVDGISALNQMPRISHDTRSGFAAPWRAFKPI
jgi:hypothetical protein